MKHRISRHTKARSRKPARRPESQVARRRRSRRSRVQTTAMIKRGRAYYWTAAEDRLLGKQPDAEVARLVGRAIAAVARRRQEAGIIFRPNPRWTKAEDRLLAQSLKEPRRRNATRELARQLGRSQAAVEMRRRKKFGRVQRTPRAWTRREERLLGTRSDAEVARLINRHLSVVHKRRHRLGIASIVQRRP